MTVVELMVASTLGLMVLAFTGTLFTTLSFESVATGKRTDAQLQTRDAFDGAIRYLQNSVPLAKCVQWNTGFTGEKFAQSNASKCARYQSDGAVVSQATETSFTTYAYTDKSGVGSGAAPDKLTFVISGFDANTILTVSKQTFTPTNKDHKSMMAAYCAGNTPNACSSYKWSGSSTLWSFPVSPGSTFTFLGTDGTAITPPITNLGSIRTVIVNLTVKFKPTAAQANWLENSYPFYASVSLRGASYADELNPGKR
ncbi:MAG: hypothetical protein ACOYN3_10300 [Acidimicrobiia bacterium]